MKVFPTTIITILSLISFSVYSEEITCGLKNITVKNGKVVKIVHEDGTVHSGKQKYWEYNGKTLTHSLMKKPIKCGNKPKSREEIIQELSKRFTENPKAYGMNTDEAQMMANYTAELMKNNQQCHLLVDASKSVNRKGMFFIDCNDKTNNPKRFWISEHDLKSMKKTNAMTPLPQSEAVQRCNNQIKSKIAYPDTYDPSLLTGTSHSAIGSVGRNVVEITFESQNAYGTNLKNTGRCIFENGKVIEISIN